MEELIENPTLEYIQPFIEASKRLEKEGVGADNIPVTIQASENSTEFREVNLEAKRNVMNMTIVEKEVMLTATNYKNVSIIWVRMFWSVLICRHFNTNTTTVKYSCF